MWIMKKLFSFIFAVVFVIASTGLSFPAQAIIPGEDAAPINNSITYGQIQELLEEYFVAQQIDLSPGTEHFYQYAFNQVHEEEDQILVNHPAYEQIVSYLIRYMLLYQDYLIVSHAIQHGVESPVTMIETSFSDNPCLIYDGTTSELHFVLTDGFLTQTLTERKMENEARIAAAASTFSQTASSYRVPSYSPTDAINYAYSYVRNDSTADPPYAQSYSPLYPAFGDVNCTNYVSQCVHAGGLAMKGSNSSAGAHQSTTNWYCYPVGSSFSYSTSWVRAADFYSYFYKNANKTTLYYTIEDLYENCRPGDVVQLSRTSNSEIHHSIIITKKDYNTAYYCANSDPYRDADISRLANKPEKFILHTFLPETPVPGTPLTNCGVCGAVPGDVRHQSSVSYDRVIPCPLHNEIHDAQEVYTTYYTYCRAHNRLLGSGTQMTGYECLY